MTIAIRAEGLHKRFGHSQALAGVDLEVAAGTVLGLLGPNGAGKTTTVRVLTTLIAPDAGRAEVAGFDVVRHPQRVRAQIGVTGQYSAIDGRLTGQENLVMVGRLYHLTRRAARRQADALLERFDLTAPADRPARTYSGGMRRRLDLAASLMARPTVLFLDEPTTGLDPGSRLDLWLVVEDLVAAGTTVLLTTQYLDEVDRLADRIAVVDHGRVIAEGTADDLKRRAGGEMVAVQVRERAELDTVAAVLATIGPAVPVVDRGAGQIVLSTSDGVGTLAHAARALNDSGAAVSGMELRRPSLDEVFLAMTETSRSRMPQPQLAGAMADYPTHAAAGRGTGS
jgi:ABC-2 type transport system ATP-binding protein